MIAKKILYWYDNNKRSLPWRNKCSLKQKEYFTLVSEFMLQQTQVKTVIPYFNNFLKNIPDFQALAKVNENKLLRYWQGLGYYSRANNLKKSARVFLEKYYINYNPIIEETCFFYKISQTVHNCPFII